MKQIRNLLIVFGWLLVWQLISILVGNKILLVGPVQTLRSLVVLALQVSFWKACFGTIFRITVGFLGGMLIGGLFAIASAKKRIVEEILAPPIVVMKSIPVASFVVIFLIWWGSEYLAMVISFFIVLPNLYINTLEGIKSTDNQLLEMAQVFGVSDWNRFFYIYRPALKPFLDSAVKVSAGMSWKAGVAAEVIGLPTYAIGEQLYMSKIYLETANVLAWTVAIILLSMLFEKVIIYVWKRFSLWEPACRITSHEFRRKVEAVSISEAGKYYRGKAVLEKVTAKYEPDKIYYFDSPSGSGKTTLFRLIAGLEELDEGTIRLNGQRVAFLFQEDRLCEDYSALKNVELVVGNKGTAKQHLLQLLEEEDIYKPCRELSGGMKRRVALARTFASAAEVILLDEPYNGLDETNRMRVQEYIERNRKNAVVLMASHVR